MNYYNERDPKLCSWLEDLMKKGMIRDGFVDNRDIKDVRPEDLEGYEQCHFFAGIGGWCRALEGWEGEVWTGSCPCQPFSSAANVHYGGHKRERDARNIWSHFHNLIAECRPQYIFGEQVAGKAGETWFDTVQHEMAATGYTCGMSVLAACSVGAPHLRKRLYWGAKRLADTNGEGPQRRKIQPEGTRQEPRYVRPCGMDDHWGDIEWLKCIDGWRPFEPTIQPMVDGFSSRLGRVTELKGASNAIVPQCGAAFVEAFYGSCKE